MIIPQIANPQIFKLITLSQNRINHEYRLGERLQTRTVHVKPTDLPLQYFSWIGKDFVELMLVFGARSSADIYGRLAKLVLCLVLAYMQ